MMTMVRIGSMATLSEISHHAVPERAAKSAQVVRVAGWKWRDEHPAMLPRARAIPKHGLMDSMTGVTRQAPYRMVALS